MCFSLPDGVEFGVDGQWNQNRRFIANLVLNSLDVGSQSDEGRVNQTKRPGSRIFESSGKRRGGEILAKEFMASFEYQRFLTISVREAIVGERLDFRYAGLLVSHMTIRAECLRGEHVATASPDIAITKPHWLRRPSQFQHDASARRSPSPNANSRFPSTRRLDKPRRVRSMLTAEVTHTYAV